MKANFVKPYSFDRYDSNGILSELERRKLVEIILLNTLLDKSGYYFRL